MLLVPTYIGPSKIHGLGLFAKEFIPKGTRVWQYQPGFDQAISPPLRASLPPLTEEMLLWFGYRDKTGWTYLCGDNDRFANHSEDPPTMALPGFTPIETAPDIASRDIQADEEITYNYRIFDVDAAWKLGPH